MLSTGVDIIEIDRIQKTLERWGPRFLHRIYTEGELAYCRGRIPQLAARFAAKEAVMKALGTGIRGVGWKEVEVVRRRGQAPTVQLHSRALAHAQRQNMSHISISLSHSRDYAVAFVVAEMSKDVSPPALNQTEKSTLVS